MSNWPAAGSCAGVAAAPRRRTRENLRLTAAEYGTIDSAAVNARLSACEHGPFVYDRAVPIVTRARSVPGIMGSERRMETFLVIVTVMGIGLLALSIILALFEPAPEYRIAEPVSGPLDSPDFARMLAVLSDAQEHTDTSVQVLSNGQAFYEAELQAIRGARNHICLEAYIFQKGEIASRFIEELTGRAQAGVKVRIVLDAVGSFNTWRRDFRDLIAAGGEVH